MEKHKSLINLTILCVLFLAWYFILWPGLYYGDTFSDYLEATHGEVDYQASPLYYIYLTFLTKITDAPWIFGVANIVMVISCLIRLLQIIYKYCPYNPYYILPIVIFFLWPLNGAIVFAYTRDFWACWLHILLAIELFNLSVNKKYLKVDPNKFQLFWILVLSSMNGLIRKENIILIIITMLVLFILKIRSKFLCLSSIAIYFLSFIALPLMLNMSPKDVLIGEYKYQLVGMINPLSYMLRNNKRTLLTDEDKSNISQIIPYDVFMRDNNNYSNGPSNFKKIIDKNGNAFPELKKIYYRLVIENPDVFIWGRFKMGLALLGLNNPIPKISDTYFDNKGRNAKKVRLENPQFLNVARSYPQLARKIINFIDLDKHKIVKILFESSLPALVSSLIFVMFWKIYPSIAIASLVILCRIPIVFATAPVSQFRYVYSLYIFGLIIFYLFLIERSAREKYLTKV